jgi:hypothetical protein
MSSDLGGWDIPANDPCCKEWEASDSKLVVDSPVVSRGWLSVEGGIEVSIEVCSDLKDSKEECPACRLPAFTDHLSVIDLVSRLLLAEVAQPLVPVEMLTRSLSPSNMLPEAISEALGIDLPEVLSLYFGELDDSRRG